MTLEEKEAAKKYLAAFKEQGVAAKKLSLARRTFNFITALQEYDICRIETNLRYNMYKLLQTEPEPEWVAKPELYCGG